MAATQQSLLHLVGKRIVCTQMADDPQAIPAGTQGTVRSIDDALQIHVQWDNGSRLALIPGVDQWEELP